MRVTFAAKILLLALMGLSAALVARAQESCITANKPLMMLVVDTSGSMEGLPDCTCETNACDECLPDCDSDTGTDEMNRWATALEALTGSFPEPYQCETYERNNSDEFGFDFGYQIPYHQPWECGESDPGPCPSTVVQEEDGILDKYKTQIRFGLMTFDSQPTYVGAEYLVSKAAFNREKSDSEDGLWSYGLGDGFPPTLRERGDNSKVGLLHFPNCSEDFVMDTGARSEDAVAVVDGKPQPQGKLISALSTDNMETTNEQIQNALLAARPYGGTPLAAAMDDLYYYFDQLEDGAAECRGTYAVLITDGRPDDDYRAESGCDCKTREGCCQAYHKLETCDSVSDLETNPEYDPASFQCPYPTPVEVADALVNGYDDSGGVLTKCFVVGFATPCNSPYYCPPDYDGPCDAAVTDPPWDPTHETEGCKVRDLLDDIAEACSRDGLGKAVFADSLTDLQAEFDTILTEISTGAISFSEPSFLNTSNNAGLAQYQFETSFEMGSESQAWWGKLERKRFECNEEGAINEADASSDDKFHEVLDDRNLDEGAADGNPRKLWTVLPRDSTDCGTDDHACTPKDHLFRSAAGAPCGEGRSDYCELVQFENPDDPYQPEGVMVEHLELPSLRYPSQNEKLARRYQIMKWVHGVTADRQNHRLGDIYHSSPAVVGKPDFRLSDDEYGQFRYTKAVATRPPVLFVGSNDGILHAFSVDHYEASTDHAHDIGYAVGEEMWGFIPPILLHNLESASIAHTFMVDGSPVVKDVPLSRVPERVSCQDDAGSDDDFCNFRTVLVTGLRGGGNAYIALDVTDPVLKPGDPGTDADGNPTPGPRFLWQFTHPDLGDTYGRPALGQVVVKWNGSTNQPDPNTGTLMERAVAILPGGVGSETDTPGACDSMKNPNDSNNPYYTRSSITDFTAHSHRPQVRCWKTTGRSVFVVDVETGVLIKQIGWPRDADTDEHVFPSPVVGTPALYQGDVGTLATRAFVADADGVLWRIDLSRPDAETDSSLDGWTARPFHDMYWRHGTATDAYKIGELTYEAPVLSVDDQGRVVVLYATGETECLVESWDCLDAQNYVVSLTEMNVPSGVIATRADLNHIKAAFNWEYDLLPSEMVTGSLELFNRRLYFSSVVVAPFGPCGGCYSRLFAVDYVQRSESTVPDTNPLTYYPQPVADQYLDTNPDDEIDTASLFNTAPEESPHPDLEDVLYFGMGITRRPSCFSTESGTFDNIYGQLGGLGRAAASAPATYELVSMVSGGGSEAAPVTIEQAPPQQMNTIEAFAGTCE
jgi:type IV pilus assembly protein PilY1